MNRESKRTKRLKRAATRLKRDVSKKVKILETVSVGKHPKELLSPSPCKIPLVLKKDSISNAYMRWSREKEDRIGTWPWGVSRDWGKKTWDTVILPFLRDYEKKKWGVIHAETWQNKRKTRKKHIYYDKDKICEEARHRLVELEFDDQTKIFRFRLSGKRRLYGFTFDEVFATIWYDPTHKIYPID